MQAPGFPGILHGGQYTRYCLIRDKRVKIKEIFIGIGIKITITFREEPEVAEGEHEVDQDVDEYADGAPMWPPVVCYAATF